MQIAPRSRHRIASLLAVGGALLLLVASCSSGGSDAASGPATTSKPPEVGQEVAAAALADGRTVIDVRTPEEYAAGHIDGAVLVDVSSSAFDDDVAGLDRKASYVVYCRSGNRSAQAARRMRDAGLDVVDGGAMADMQSAGWELAS